MKENRTSIFAPNLIANCVDGTEQGCYFGRIYHSYSVDPYNYWDVKDMLLLMEAFFDRIHFPAASTENRTFLRVSRKPIRKERVKRMQNQQVLNHRGERATFIIQVQYRQNSTWQGKILWAEENKTQHFRSALELLKLIDSALSIKDDREDGNRPNEICFESNSKEVAPHAYETV